MSKQKWLSIAETIDALRLVPRAAVFTLISLYSWYVVHVTQWFMAKEVTTVSDTTFVSATISALGVVLGIVVNAYMQSGRKWKNESNREENLY